MKHANCFLIFFLSLFVSAVHAQPPDFVSSIHGHWSGKTTDGTEISYTFSEDGQLTWYVDEKNFKKTFPNGLVGKYKITVAKPYIKIDINNFEHPAFKSFAYLGIIEIIDKKRFRIEAVPTHPSRQTKRPEKFTKAAVVFQKSKKDQS